MPVPKKHVLSFKKPLTPLTPLTPNAAYLDASKAFLAHIYARQEAPDENLEAPEKNSQPGNFPAEAPVIGKQSPVVGKQAPVIGKEVPVTKPKPLDKFVKARMDADGHGCWCRIRPNRR